MGGEVRSFKVADFVVFALMLAISAGIGIFYACQSRKKKTTGEFLMGGRGMQVVPVSISILLSFMSAILILGTPAEMYNEGTEYYIHLMGMAGAILLSAFLFVPLLYPLQLTSAFEYLEKRFRSRAAKITGTCIMIIQQVVYMGIASYAPSTALEAVTGFPTWAAIIIVGFVSTFYTSLGGMKAVVWTDVFQAAVMLTGILAVVIQGTISVGGMDEVWRLNEEWGRIHFFDFNADPTVRHSFWSLVIGGMIGWTSTYGVNQASVQRYSSLPTRRKAQVSVLLNVVGIAILMTLVCLCGIVVFAYYAQKGCDPLSADLISNSNQLVPFFVMEVLGYPGLPGLFVSCLFSGALSSMSSCLNALAAVCWEDFLKPTFDKRLTERQKTLVTKLLVLLFGGAGIGMAFIAMNLGGTVLQASLSFTGAVSGPLLGMFTLGAFFPCSNWIGAVVGGIVGLAFPMWILIGAYTLVRTPSGMEFPIANCSLANVTDSMTTNTSILPVELKHTGVSVLYSVSYLWYPAIGASTVILVGLVVSVITGADHIGDVDDKYLIPVFDRLFHCLPGPVSRVLRCNQELEESNAVRVEEKDGMFILQASDDKKRKGVSEKLSLNDPVPSSVYGIAYRQKGEAEKCFLNSGSQENVTEKVEIMTKF